jgi:hypothetical protein
MSSAELLPPPPPPVVADITDADEMTTTTTTTEKTADTIDAIATAAAAVTNVSAPTFQFTPVEQAFSGFLGSSEGRERMQRWNIDQHLVVRRFRFGGGRLEADSRSSTDTLLLDFVNSQCGRSVLPTASENSEAAALEWREVNRNVINMNFFNRFRDGEHNLVSSTGYLRKCMDDTYDGVHVSESLRECLVNENSEHAVDLIYDDAERDEFIFRIFRHLVVGGAMCQPDETWGDYLVATKDVYRNLVSVHKSTKTGKVEVSSRIYELRSVEGNFELFQAGSPHNVCFVVVDPAKHTITCWYNPFISYW